MKEYRIGPYLLAVESDSGDRIALGLLDGSIVIHGFNERLEDIPTAAQLLLVPCPFVLDCDGVNGQFACAEMDGPIDSKEQAILMGWKDIRFDPFALGSSYLGVCPRCQKEGGK